MTEIYRFRNQTIIIRRENAEIGRAGGWEQVTRLTRNGGERRSAFRPDVVRLLGQRIGQDVPQAIRHRENGQLVAR